jgi:hypothetical protein
MNVIHFSLSPRFLALGLAFTASLASACGEAKEPTVASSGTRLAITVAPLDLPRLDDACYDLTVYNAAQPANGQVVWSKQGICASQYGDAQASIAYVGSCDASGPGGQRDNSVRLVLTDLCEGGACVVPGPGPTSLAASSYANPCPAPGGCVLSRPCRENQDTPVVFNLTVLRSANQGFFDIAVNFEDIFCSAKFDCEGPNGKLQLLHDPATNQRATTVVLGFACTSGANQETWLYMNDVVVTCRDRVTNAVTSVTSIDPSEGPGNMGDNGPLFFQTASYRGPEALEPYEKCYWNLALGVRESQLNDACTLSVRATAADRALTNDRTPTDTVYPVIDWSIALNSVPGAIDCGKHAVNAPGSDVTTSYTPLTGEAFTHFVACDDPQTAGGNPGRKLCDGVVPGLNAVTSMTFNDGVLTAAVGALSSPGYTLPEGYRMGGCCLDPCCSE